MGKMEELKKWETKVEYKITDISTQLSEMHDKILLRETVNFCNEYKILDYEISIDMLKEALSLYIDKKEREKFGKDNNVGKWIPVSERLPKDGQTCLVTTKGFLDNICCEITTYSNNLYKIDKFDFNDKRNVSGFYNYDSEYGYYEVTDVIAWMPLPEPYKESEVE